MRLPFAVCRIRSNKRQTNPYGAKALPCQYLTIKQTGKETLHHPLHPRITPFRRACKATLNKKSGENAAEIINFTIFEAITQFF